MTAADIRTAYWRKPIPTDRFDWEAWLDGQEERYGSGFGSTREAAIVELLEMVEADDDPQPGELARLRAEIARLRGE